MSMMRSLASALRTQLARASTPVATQMQAARFMASSAPDAASAATVESFRAANGFRRWLDGRVQLKGANGSWHDLKLDANVEGSLLTRDAEGRVYYLSGALQQVDLSNDEFIGNLFGNGQWEEVRQPLFGNDAAGKPAHISMTADQFRRVLSILKEVPPPKAEKA